MILIDANLLVYAYNQAAPEHRAARPWLELQFNRSPRIGLPWPSLLAFVRLVSNPLVVRHPIRPADAWNRVEEWLDRDNVWIPAPDVRHREILSELLSDPRMTSRLVSDAHLAAIAIEQGLKLYSTDADFGRFRGLQWENPLAGPA